MENRNSTHSYDVGGEPGAVKVTSRYLRRLLIESPYIYAALLNPGGSIILTGTAATTDGTTQYTSDIGSDAHLDLVEVTQYLREDFSKEEIDALWSWAEGMNSQQAAHYRDAKGGALRKRRERAVNKLEKTMEHGDS